MTGGRLPAKCTAPLLLYQRKSAMQIRHCGSLDATVFRARQVSCCGSPATGSVQTAARVA